MACSLSVRGGTVAVALGGRALFVRRDNVENRVALEGVADAEGVRLAEDGLLAAAWSRDGTVRLAETATGAAVAEWRLERAARRVRFAGDALLATERGGGVVLLERGAPPAPIASPPGLPLDALLGPRRDRLVVADRDEKIRVCRHPRTHDVVSFCLGHEEFVSAIEPLPHHPETVLSASGDGSVRAWDVETGATLLRLEAEPAPGGPRAVERVVCCRSRDGDDRSLLALSTLGSETAAVHRIVGPPPTPRAEFVRTIDLGGRPFGLAADEDDLWAIAHDGTVNGWNMITGDRLNPIPLEDFGVIERNDLEILNFYKRKIDNLHEYRERKRQRLEGRS